MCQPSTVFTDAGGAYRTKVSFSCGCSLEGFSVLACGHVGSAAVVFLFRVGEGI